MNKKDVNIEVVANRIRTIRKNLGLSMEEFASRIDERAKSGTVSNWETGKNLPNNKRLNKIAELGGMSLEQLLHGSLDNYIIRRVKKHFENNDSISLDEEGKKKVLDDTLKQALMDPILAAEYEDSQINNLNNSIDFKIKRAIERLLNNTDFTNIGFIKFVTLEIDSLQQRSFNYLNNGINKDLYSEVTTILGNCKNNVNDLKEKYDNN